MTDLQFNGDRLADLMKRKKVSDGDVAKSTGLSRTMIYYLRKGKRKSASAENIAKIAEALETNTNYFLTDSAGDTRVAVMLPEPLRQLAEVAGRLSEVRQGELLRIAAALEELEREQVIYSMPAAVMQELIAFADQIEEEGSDTELLPILETLFRQVSRGGRDRPAMPRLPGSGSAQEPPNDPI